MSEGGRVLELSMCPTRPLSKRPVSVWKVACASVHVWMEGHGMPAHDHDHGHATPSTSPPPRDLARRRSIRPVDVFRALYERGMFVHGAASTR
ncbi:hypothetical protein SCHPADRAFT_948405 [Schizopora paradoxa]|uniref:Uncharacterized protein n=1 Tax=Schizopora paradoxa TaxID=27342 RepID=A0A0H2QWR3_9AGAM|nr:hypothetical protein SCHPADRAFT_948405 [Schizopora paradoxa]